MRWAHTSESETGSYRMYDAHIQRRVETPFLLITFNLSQIVD